MKSSSGKRKRTAKSSDSNITAFAEAVLVVRCLSTLHAKKAVVARCRAISSRSTGSDDDGREMREGRRSGKGNYMEIVAANRKKRDRNKNVTQHVCKTGDEQKRGEKNPVPAFDAQLLLLHRLQQQALLTRMQRERATVHERRKRKPDASLCSTVCTSSLPLPPLTHSPCVRAPFFPRFIIEIQSRESVCVCLISGRTFSFTHTVSGHTHGVRGKSQRRRRRLKRQVKERQAKLVA